MERTSQLILRNEARLPPGPLLLLNPPRDTLPRQLQDSGRTVHVASQHFGDYGWLSGSGVSASFEACARPDPHDQAIILHLPREKERLVMMLHAASSAMARGARLWLVGENRAGIKSARRYLETHFGRVGKLDSARHCGLFEAAEPVTDRPFDLSDYELVWELLFAGKKTRIVSLPGIFAHGRLDAGSRLLLRTLENIRPEGRILDFACGSGVIGCALLAANTNITMTMLDVSALAMAASERSLAHNGLTATLLPSDGLLELRGHCDWIISNPPFHQGVSNDLETANRFFAEAGTFLAEKGRIVIVCNRHLPYESWLQKHFNRVERLATNNEFMIIQADDPRT